MSRETKEKRKAELRKQRSRRRFLKMLAVGVGGVAAAATGLSIWRPWASRPLPDKWAFLQRDIDLSVPGDTWRYITDNYVLLGPERKLTKDDKKLEELFRMKKPLIQEEVERRKWKDISMHGTEQLFGRPEEIRFAEQYSDYLHQCIDYLYSRLSQLEKVPLEIMVLKKGQDFSDVRKGRAFVGYSFHEVQRLYVRDKETRDVFAVGSSANSNGSYTLIKSNYKIGKLEEYLVFFGTGSNAMGSVFSELIPLATIGAFSRYSNKYGHEKGRIAAEALSEGISYLLTSDMIKELSIPGGKETLDQTHAKMRTIPRYCLVPASIRWLKQNGIERGLEIYMEDPEKYIKAIDEGVRK